MLVVYPEAVLYINEEVCPLCTVVPAGTVALHPAPQIPVGPLHVQAEAAAATVDTVRDELQDVYEEQPVDV